MRAVCFYPMSEITRKEWALYPGTFDPITLGHVDLVERIVSVFQGVVVLIAHSEKKKPLFSVEERLKMVENCFKGRLNIKVESSRELLAHFAQRCGIRVIVRGLRAVSDFEYEFQMATINRRMMGELETFFLMASEKYFFVNSTVVKEVLAHGGNVSQFVPSQVEQKLKEKLCGNLQNERKV